MPCPITTLALIPQWSPHISNSDVNNGCETLISYRLNKLLPLLVQHCHETITDITSVILMKKNGLQCFRQNSIRVALSSVIAVLTAGVLLFLYTILSNQSLDLYSSTNLHKACQDSVLKYTSGLQSGFILHQGLRNLDRQYRKYGSQSRSEDPGMTFTV